MSSRYSMHSDDVRLMQAIDTDTTDYYDGMGGLPPPHRLSGLYPTSHSFSASSDSLHHTKADSQSGHPTYHSPKPSFSTAPLNFNAMQPSQQPHQYPSTQAYQYPYKTDQYPSHADLNNEWDVHGLHDDEAFLNGNPSGRLSPAVAARERYMARKEAAGSPYGYGANTMRRDANRGCFAGKKKWIWLGALLALVAIIAGAVAGVLISKNKSSASNGVTGAVQSDSNDPSVFTKNPSLHKSFYGLCYTPLNAQYPACGDTIDSVIEDIQLLSQLTTRLRLYGSDCDVTSLVLEAIQKTKVNMTIFPAAWLPQASDDPDNVVYNRQVSELQAAIKKYGVDNIEAITVGNEFLLNGGSETELIAKMAAMRTTLKGMNLPKTLPVGTADAGSMITTTLSQGSDYVMANVHPWFGGVPIDQAAGWVYSYTANQEPSSATLATNDPKIYIAETGWPTGANETEFLTYEASVAGVPEMNTFLADYVCEANKNITSGGQFSNYFYFEAFDEPWKEIYGGVEPYWGLFNANKTLKSGVVIPDCAAP